MPGRKVDEMPGLHGATLRCPHGLGDLWLSVYGERRCRICHPPAPGAEAKDGKVLWPSKFKP